MQDPSIAKENLRRYPWAREIVDGWRTDVSYTLSKNRGFFEWMMPGLPLACSLRRLLYWPGTSVMI